MICKNPRKKDTVLALRCFQILATLAPFYNTDAPERLEQYRHMVTVCGTELKLRPRVQRSHFIINSCAERSPSCHSCWLNSKIVNHEQNLMISLCGWTNLLVFPFLAENSEVAQCVEASSLSVWSYFSYEFYNSTLNTFNRIWSGRVKTWVGEGIKRRLNSESHNSSFEAEYKEKISCLSVHWWQRQDRGPFEKHCTTSNLLLIVKRQARFAEAILNLTVTIWRLQAAGWLWTCVCLLAEIVAHHFLTETREKIYTNIRIHMLTFPC